MNLKSKIRNLPNSSGVYQYFDKNGKLLYIGKAKNLKNRVKSYFKFQPDLQPSPKLSPRIYKMISETTNLEYIIVENEHDALLLENSLIKQLKPKYNILLRDDKTYPYIAIDLNQDFPRFEITRKVIKNDKIKYFGPFSSSAKELLEAIYLNYNLVQRKGSLKNKKACLFYQIKRCQAPCEGKISKTKYLQIVQDAINAIKNRDILIEKLKKRMIQSAQREDFEEAAKLRDMIKALKNQKSISEIDLAKLEDIDIIYLHKDGSSASIVKIFVRDGRVISTDYDIYKSSSDFEISELYKRAFLQFYKKESLMLAKTILVGEEFEYINELERYLKEIYSKKIKIKVPKRGEKAKLIKLARKNAKALLEQNGKKETILNSIKELFDLESVPYRIEIFDNSHLGGEASVGSMVVWEENFKKEDYRKYKLSAKDEYSQMRELLKRRVDSFEKNPPPDLWIIDGGATLLKLALEIIDSCGVNLDVIAISKEKSNNKSIRSKGRAKDILHSKFGTLRLRTDDKRLQFIQRLRDEAHRFAITFHKKSKLKNDMEDELLKIEGLGKAKLKRLLSYFGSYEKIFNANIEELESIIGKKVANLLFFSKKNRF